MSIYTSELNYRWRDFPGEYLPHTLSQLTELYKAGCFALRFYQAPQKIVQEIVNPGYVKATLQIPCGSFLVSIDHDEAAVETPPFTVQITDVGANWKLFSQPIPDSFIQKNEGIPNFLHRPYPIAEPGILTCEFWNVSGAVGAAQICNITLGVAEIPRK